MGMIGNFLRVSQRELNLYLENSSKLEDAIYSEEEETLNLLDTDKAWDGIFYLLMGNGIGSIDYANPTSMSPLLVCNQLIDGSQDLGYGPAHYVKADEVKKFSTILAPITRDELYVKFNPSDMEEQDVYPSIWNKEKDEAFEYLYNSFQMLQNFYEDASNADEAIIFFIN